MLVRDIAKDCVELDQYSYFDEPGLFKIPCGFGEYHIDLDDTDMNDTYVLISKHLTTGVEELKNMADHVSPISQYLDELIRVGSGDNLSYLFRDNTQPKDLILFLMSYARFVAIKMMLTGTWNWRVTILRPHTAYDQLLCKKAKEMEIDVVIFVTENSTGMYNIRSEVMDSRDRDMSYNNLIIRNILCSQAENQ